MSLSALDAQVRKELRRWLRQLHEELKFTSVFVTHDQEEAMEVADRVVVMSQGNIEQADAPNQVWREPATRFVLEFMGEVNRLKGTISGGQFHVGAHRWPLGYTRGGRSVSAPVGSRHQPPYQPGFTTAGTGAGSYP
jgi:sulfate transport system ATP-binding protein